MTSVFLLNYIDHYKIDGRLVSVSADGSPEAVAAQSLAALEDHAAASQTGRA